VCEPLCEGAMVAEGAIFQEVVLEPATEFPRMYFVGKFRENLFSTIW
jgi:hypothetical protein